MAWTLLPIRLLLGLFALFFAYYFGRTLAAKWDRLASTGRLLRWALRLALCVFGLVWTGLDWITFVLLGLAALSAGLGFYAQSRPSGHNGDSVHLSFGG